MQDYPGWSLAPQLLPIKPGGEMGSLRLACATNQDPTPKTKTQTEHVGLGGLKVGRLF